MDVATLKPLYPESLVPALNPTLVTDGAGLGKIDNYFKRLASQTTSAAVTPEFAIDYETNFVPTFYERKARTLQLGDKNEQYIIDFLAFAETTEKIQQQGNFTTPSWAKHIVKTLEPALNSNAFLKVGHRLGFEYQVSWWNLGIPLWHIYSIDMAERIIWAGLHTFKDVNFYSLAGQVGRYFGVEVDKSEQKLFDLESPLTEKQIIYACLDLRMPLAVRAKQLPILRRDNLERITQIENDAIGFFEDIHLNGFKTSPDWAKLVDEWTQKYCDSLKQLDTHFLPIVGPKNLDDSHLDGVLNEWKSLTEDSAEELGIKAEIKATKDKEGKDQLRAQLAQVLAGRKILRDEARARYITERQKVAAAKKVFDEAEGEAAINYGSNAQLRDAMLKMKGFNKTNLSSTDDGVLDKLKDKPVVKAIREYRKYKKLLETYGAQWYTPYKTEPSAEEGWVNPHTGKIHSTINQLEAETGRTSSTKPNLQNLPADKRVRSCFIADEPNEDVRVSNCCDADTVPCAFGGHQCTACNSQCETHAEENVVITCDMSGAELRIIAEESGSKVWIDAFNNNWDVHSVGTELLYPEEWPAAAAKPGDTILVDGKPVELPPCAYFTKDHKKCKCPKHLELRDDNKATNFLLAYGGGPEALADAINYSRDEDKEQMTEGDAKVLMGKHEKANPEVWAYLERSGKQAVKDLESRSKCGRRRRFHMPTWEAAKEQARERMFESLKKKGKNVLDNGEKLKIEDIYPETWQIKSALRGMYGSIERRGKNHRIQSLNASIAKRACGAGFDKDGKPYLWHTLKQYRAKAKNFVHDEVVAMSPKHHAERVLALIQDAFKRAGAEFLETVAMESEGRIAFCWQK